MPAFADLEARVNASCLASLANATASCVALAIEDAEVIAPLPQHNVDAAGILQHTQVILADATAWLGVSEGMALTLRGVAHTVRYVEPDLAPGGLLRIALAKD